ncbi:hypothetical protein Syun_008464 [Stephania yunnanensis]|uniref:Secreted protein n=1 Tax=Stephania yunnanensis TaxID=152371 RepID=A0AAP0KDU3_9MAGN
MFFFSLPLSITHGLSLTPLTLSLLPIVLSHSSRLISLTHGLSLPQLTAASALAGDRTRDAGGGRQPELAHRLVCDGGACIRRRAEGQGTVSRRLFVSRLDVRLVQFAEKLTRDLHGSRPGVPKCIGNLGPSQLVSKPWFRASFENLTT